MKFGPKIREVRNKLGMTQKEFGKKLGVGQVAISIWETTDQAPSLKLLFKIVKLAEKHGIKLEFGDFI